MRQSGWVLVVSKEQALLEHRAELLVKLPRVSPGHRMKTASPEHRTMASSVLGDRRGLERLEEK